MGQAMDDVHDASTRREAIARALARHEAEHGPLDRIRHSVQLTSFGGSGSTALSAHLAAAGADLPKTPGEFPFKHQRVPPLVADVPPSFRVIYLTADPRNAMMSIFRRGFIVGHYMALHRREPPPDVAQRVTSLDAFLAGGIDDFGLEDHLDRWMAPLDYPVLVVRFEALPNVWNVVREFAGLPDSVPCLDLRPRASDWTTLSEEHRRQFDAIYGRLARRIDALPDAHLTRPLNPNSWDARR